MENDELLENCRIEIVQFIDHAGEMNFTVRQRGEVPLSTQLGLLEMAKIALMRPTEET